MNGDKTKNWGIVNKSLVVILCFLIIASSASAFSKINANNHDISKDFEDQTLGTWSASSSDIKAVSYQENYSLKAGYNQNFNTSHSITMGAFDGYYLINGDDGSVGVGNGTQKVEVQFINDGSHRLYVLDRDGISGTAAEYNGPETTFTPSGWYMVRIRSVDDKISYKLWSASNTEPSTWTDSFVPSNNGIDLNKTKRPITLFGSSSSTYNGMSLDEYGMDNKVGYAQTVSGQITDSSGNPIANADVIIEDSGGSVVFSGTTDSNGEYSTELKDGDYTITASKSKYHSSSSAFSVSGSAVTQNLTIESQEIRGTIQDPKGNLISGSDIIVKNKATNNVVLNITGASTNYDVTVADGDYWVNVSHPDYESNETSVSLTSSENTDAFHDVILRMSNEVSGDVTDTNGNALGGATVKIFNNNISKQATTDKNGSYSVLLKDGDYTVNVTKITYKPYESQISINSSTNLNDIQLEAKEYNLNLRISPYMNYSGTQKYVVRFNEDVITENVEISSSNISLVTRNNKTLTLNATDNVNISGEVNITATYRIDGKTLTDSENVTVSSIEIDKVEILSPLYSTLAIMTDKTMQFLILALIAGVGIASITNAFGGIGLMIICLIMGWIMDYIPLGVLLASLFGGIFIMLNTRMREYREV